MGFIHAEDVPKNLGKDVCLRGWVYRHRASSEFVFIILRDASGIVQCTIRREDVPNEVWNAAKDLYIESSFEVCGKVKEDKRAPGGFEIKVSNLKTISRGQPFPIQKDLSEEFLLDVRHLWLRSQRMTNIMKVRHWTVKYLREFFEKEGFYEVVPPIITKAGCEGGSTLFEFDYFGDKAYLSQSGQLYGEAFIYSLEKIYLLAPSFRAEKSRTVRHLAEYWHLEPEMAFFDHEMNMELQERMIKYTLKKLIDNHGELLEKAGRKPEELEPAVSEKYERIYYEDAVEMVNKLGGRMKLGEDFGADEEKILTKDRNTPIFITNFPSKIKAFYMKDDPERPGTVLAADVLAPQGHGEIIGGSERIADYETLTRKIKEFGLNPKDYEWYLDLRRYGSVPHSGFGLGIERFIKWILNLDHIRDAIPFPRTITRCYP